MAQKAADAQKLIRERVPVYFAINTQLRNDLGRFVSVKNWESLNDKTFNQVKAYFVYHLSMFAMHWHNQEEHFLPTLLRFLGKESPSLQNWDVDLGPDRKAIRELQAKISKLITSKTDELRKSFEQYERMIDKYLDKEQDVITSVFSHVTKEKFDEIERAIFQEQDPKEMRVTGAWMIAGMDDHMRKDFFTKTGLVVPLLWKIVLKRQFNKRVAVFKQFE